MSLNPNQEPVFSGALHTFLFIINVILLMFCMLCNRLYVLIINKLLVSQGDKSFIRVFTYHFTPNYIHPTIQLFLKPFELRKCNYLTIKKVQKKCVIKNCENSVRYQLLTEP